MLGLFDRNGLYNTFFFREFSFFFTLFDEGVAGLCFLLKVFLTDVFLTEVFVYSSRMVPRTQYNYIIC